MMVNESFDAEKLVNYWVESSDEDFSTMIIMYETKRYNWSLFIGHLMIEKLLKALFVRANRTYPPYIHNLLRLAEQCSLELTEDQKLFFVTVTAFNINARYDDFKKSFQNKCTPEFTSVWIEEIKSNRQWIRTLILQ